MKNRKEINMNSPIDSKTNKPVIISFIKLLMTDAQLNKLDELTEEEELIFLGKLIEEFFKNDPEKSKNLISSFITLLMTEEKLNNLNAFDNQKKSTTYLSYLINKLLEKNDLTNILNKKMNKITLEGDKLIISNFIDLLMKKEELSKLTTLSENDKLSFLNQRTNEFFSKKINLNNIKSLLDKNILISKMRKETLKEMNEPATPKKGKFIPGEKRKM